MWHVVSTVVVHEPELCGKRPVLLKFNDSRKSRSKGNAYDTSSTGSICCGVVILHSEFEPDVPCFNATTAVGSVRTRTGVHIVLKLQT